MKRLLTIICIILVISQLVACDKSKYHMESFYSNLRAVGEENSYKVSSKAYIMEKEDFIYVSPSSDTKVTLSGKIEDISGDVQLVYVKPNNEVLIIADSSSSKKNSINVNTSLNLSVGEGHFEFRGEKVSFKFEIDLTNIVRKDFNYIGMEGTEDDLYEDNDFEEEEVNNVNNDLEKRELLNNVSVLFPKEDGSNVILVTSLDHSAKIKVYIRMDVTSTNDEKMKFGKIQLVYKTDDGKKFKVLEHKDTETSFGGYQSGDNYEAELTLPAGNNELVVKTAKGKNYEVNFGIQVYEIK